MKATHKFKLFSSRVKHKIHLLPQYRKKNLSALEFLEEKCLEDISTKMSKKTFIWTSELDACDDIKMNIRDTDCEDTRLRAFGIMTILLWC
jgi:hypothetical protein